MTTALEHTRTVASLIQSLHEEIALYDAKIGFTLGGRYYEDHFNEGEDEEVEAFRQRFVTRRVANVVASLKTLGVEITPTSLPEVYRRLQHFRT